MDFLIAFAGYNRCGKPSAKTGWAILTNTKTKSNSLNFRMHKTKQIIVLCNARYYKI